MATLTGANLLDSIVKSTGIALNPVLTATLTAKLQQMLDTGTYSSLAASIATSGFSTEINAATQVLDLNNSIAINAALIENAADGTEGDITFPPVGDGGGTPPPDANFTLSSTVPDTGLPEGEAATFAVTATQAVATDTVVTFSLLVGDSNAANTGTSNTNNNDFDAANLITKEVTILAGQTTATFDVTGILDNLDESAEAFSVTAAVAGEPDMSSSAQLIDKAPTAFTLTTDATSVVEGETHAYIVTAATPVAQDTDVKFKIIPGDLTAPDAGTNNTNAKDFAATAEVTVTIPAGSTTASFDVTGFVDSLPEQTESFSVQAVVEGITLTQTTSLTDLLPGATFVLTTGLDNETANQFFGSQTVFNIDGQGPTLNPGDVLTGETGRTDNTLTITDLTAGAAFNNIPAGVVLNNIQNVNLNSSGNTSAGIGFSTNNFNGIKNLNGNTNGGANDIFSAKNGADGTVITAVHNGFAGNLTVVGGTNVTATTSGGNVSIGNPTAAATVPLATEVSTGEIEVNQNNSGAGSVSVQGGTTVKVITSSSSNSGAINIGNTALNTGNSTSGALANASGEITVTTAGTGAVTVFGGTNVAVTNTALAGAGAITVGDASFTDASNLPSGNIDIIETAQIAYNGLAGSTNNNTTSGIISAFGGQNVTIATNAANTVSIGNLGAAKEDSLNPSGAISITNTGIVNTAAAGSIAVTGGTTVDVVTTGANITIGRSANTNANVIDSASNPTGNVNVTETMNMAGAGRIITIDGGADVTVNAKGQNVAIGSAAASAPTGAVLVNQADIFTGNNEAVLNGTNQGDVSVFGGTTVTVNSTGGNVTVGGVVAGVNTVASDAVNIVHTATGSTSDAISVSGGTAVNITANQIDGNITVGAGSAALNATGDALKDADLAPTGDVTIVNAGSVSTINSDVDVNTNGATTVSITGSEVDTITDIQSTLATGGANAGQAVGTSTLTSVILDANGSDDGTVAIISDVLENLTITNQYTTLADVFTVTNNTAGHALTLTQGGNVKSNITVVDNTAGSVTIKDNGTASGSAFLNTGLIVNASKATALTMDNAAAARVTLGSNATDLTSVTLIGAGNTSFAATDVFGAGNLNKVMLVDASAATGDVVAAMQMTTDNAVTQQYKGSAGKDTVTITANASGWGTNASIDGGNGNMDTLVANYAAATTDAVLGNATSINGFEILALGPNASSAAANYDASGFNEVQVGPIVANVTVTNAAKGATLSVLDDTTKTVTVVGANTTKTDDSMTVNLGTSGTDKILDPGKMITAATGAITANGIEAFTLGAVGGYKTSNVNTATLNGVASSGVATLTIIGDRSVTLTSDIGASVLDASANTGITVDVTGVKVSNAGTTFTGGDSLLKAAGSNDVSNFKALVSITGTATTPHFANTETVTVDIDGTTFVFVANANTASASDAAAALATAITTQQGNAGTTTVTNGTVTQTGANIAGGNIVATASGGNIVIADPNAAYEIMTAETGTNATVTDSLLGGQQQNLITVTAAAAVGDTLTATINGTNYIYTAPAGGATTAEVATGLAAAITAGSPAGIASAVADGSAVIVTSSIGNINKVDAIGTGTITETEAVSVNMATVNNIFNSGTGGSEYTAGLGGSWNTVATAYSSGNEDVNLAASTAKTDILKVNDGAVVTHNGTKGGVDNFVINSQSASDKLQVLTATKTILQNVSAGGTVSAVNNAATMAGVLDSSGALNTALANLTYSISNGVITFGATGGNSLSQFTTNQLINAAQILVSSSTTGGADKIVAFSSNGKSYVVASDAGNTLNAGTNSNSIVVEFNDIASVKGFGTTFGEGTIVVDNSGATDIVNLTGSAANNGGTAIDITNLAASTTLDYTGFAIATLAAANGSATAATQYTQFANLAASAELIVNDTNGALPHVGTLETTQVGAAGNNSLTVTMGTNDTIIDSLIVNGDALVVFNPTTALQTVTKLEDKTNTLTDIKVEGTSAFTLGNVTGTALSTIDTTKMASAFTFASTATPDTHNNLTFNLDTGSASTLFTSGLSNTFTQKAGGTGVVTLTASGSDNTISLGDGNNVITANGANDVISVGTGTNSITATGSNDVINIAAGAGTTTVTVGPNATVNMGTLNVADAGAETIKVSAAVTGGTSDNYASTTINFVNAENVAPSTEGDMIDFSGTGVAYTLLGSSVANSQVNVQGATTLAEALDIAANYTLLTQNQGTAATTADLAANTGEITWMQFAGDTYVVAMTNDTAAAIQQTALDANDIVVQLTGLVDLTNSAFAGEVLTI